MHWGFKVCYKNRSGLGGGDGNHPRVNDIQQWRDFNEDRVALSVSYDSDDEDMIGASWRAIDWFEDNMGLSREDAGRAAEIFLEYSKRGDTPLHLNTNIGGNDLLDKLIHDAKAPVFTGEQFRGIHITKSSLSDMGVMGQSPEDYIKGIIKGGVWREPGATSFSSEERIARSFAHSYTSDSDDVSLIIHYTGGKSGFPMRHLSSYPGENEVLHSRRQMRKGLRIYKHTSEKSTYGGSVYHVYIKD